jgi:hypothetical protein
MKTPFEILNWRLLSLNRISQKSIPIVQVQLEVLTIVQPLFRCLTLNEPAFVPCTSSTTYFLSIFFLKVLEQSIQEARVNIDAIEGVFFEFVDELCLTVTCFNRFVSNVLKSEIAEQVAVFEEPIVVLVVLNTELISPLDDAMVLVPTCRKNVLKFLPKFRESLVNFLI